MLPTFGAALRLIAARVPGLVPVVPLAGPVAEAVAAGAARWPMPPILLDTIADKHDAFAASAAALTKSGTSTLELALAGVPMLMTYRVNPLSAAIARRLVKVRYASILNLLADREVIPELIQQASTPERLAAVLRRLLVNRDEAAAQVAATRTLLDALRPPTGSPSQAAAAEVLALLDAGEPQQSAGSVFDRH
jgi:lipid-A-disaccharide synthase